VTLQREVWFEKVAWSYVPCHRKGFAVMAAVILPTLAAIFVGQTVLAQLDYHSADWLPVLIFFIPALPFLLMVAMRHS
jgi:hypothetical protein